MIKWFKKHCKKLIIASSILTVCICGLFGFTKSYAYDIDNNNHLVGNNIDSFFVNSAINTSYSTNDNNITYSKIDNNTLRIFFNGYNGASFKGILDFPTMNNQYGSSKVTFVVLLDTSNLQTTSDRFWIYGLSSTGSYYNSNFVMSSNNINCSNYGTYAVANSFALSGYSGNLGIKIQFGSNNGTFDGYIDIKCLAFENYNINYVFNNDTTFYPYSSIEQLQNAYDTLQQQYNDYVASHSYSNTQYNDLVSTNSSLQQQIATLQLQYDTYVSTHSHTDEQYNNLLSGYEDLLDIHRDLENEYDDLQQRYDDLYSSYNEIYNNKNHGYFNYLDYIEFSNGDYSSGHKSLDDLINDYIIEKLSLDVNNAFTHYVEHQLAYNYIDIYFLNETIPLELFELDFYEFSNASLTLEFYNVVLQQSRSISLTLNNGNNVVNGYAVLRALWGDSFTHEQYEEYISNAPATLYITYIQVYGDFSTSGEIYDTAINSGLAIDGDSYNFGYNQGYAIATRSANNIKAENSSLKGTISTLENNNNQLQQDYNNLNSTYQNLRQSYNDLLAGRNDLSTLFFTIAQTPFETFKTIWNVDFLGVNLAGFFTGIIMLGLMLWIVKKIF